MSAIPSITFPVHQVPLVAVSGLNPETKGAFVGVALQCIIDKVSSFAKGFFNKLAVVVGYIGAAVPGILVMLSAISLVKDIIALYKAGKMGLSRDVMRYLVDTFRDLLILMSYIASALHALAPFIKAFAYGAARIFIVISVVFGIVVALIHLIRQAIYLYQTYKVRDEIDAILKDETLTPQEKVKQILIALNTHIEEREDKNQEIVKAASHNIKEVIENFLSEQMKIEMETLLGEDTYDRIKQAISILKSAPHDDELFVKTVDALRDARAMLDNKITRHWMEIAMDVVSIVAQALCIAFPALTIPMIAVYVLWTAYGVLFVTTGIVSFLERKVIQNDNHFMERNAEQQKKFSDELLEKSYRTLRHRVVQPALQGLKHKQRIANIACILLDAQKFMQYREKAQSLTFDSLTTKLKKLLLLTLVDIKTIHTLPLHSAKDIRQTLKRYKGEFKNNPFLDIKRKELKQRLNIFDSHATRFYSEGLKREWALATTQSVALQPY